MVMLKHKILHRGSNDDDYRAAQPPMTSLCTKTSIKDLRITKKGFNSK